LIDPPEDVTDRIGRSLLKKSEILVEDGYLSPDRCRALLAAISAYRDQHEPPLIERATPGYVLRYRVIDGEQIGRHLPEFEELYRQVQERATSFSGVAMVPLCDRLLGVNVNIVPPGGSTGTTTIATP